MTSVRPQPNDTKIFFEDQCAGRAKTKKSYDINLYDNIARFNDEMRELAIPFFKSASITSAIAPCIKDKSQP